MSTVYNLEPPTKGKVTLKTTIGDLDIELWPKEAPKAVRNFVQLCLEGAYDGVIFHRVIKDFMAQTGDPTGTGEGGESVYGAPFKDEFHSRLRFNHRGLVACANRNQPHTNGAQFFITLEKCEWLDKQNTIFGKIVGDTIYNLLRLNDLEVDEATDRPADPPIIKSVDVQWNPFDDIVPRITPQERRAQEEFKKAAETRAERKGRKRNLALLSFGDDAEQEEAALAAPGAKAKIRSAHEVLQGDAKLLRPEETPEEILREQEQRAAALTAVQARLKAGAAGGGSSSDDDDDDDGSRRSSKRLEKEKKSGGAAAVVAERVRAAAEKASSARAAREAAAAATTEEEHDKGRGRRSRSRSRSRSKSKGRRSGSSSSSGGSSRSRSRSKGREGGAAAAAAAGAGGSSKPLSKEDELYTVKEKQGAGRLRVTDEVKDGELLKAFELSRQKYKTRKQQVGNRQKDTLNRLAAFTSKLRSEQEKKKQKQAAADAAAASASEGAAAAAAGAEGQQQDKPQQQQGAGEKPAAAAEEEAYAGKVRTDIDHRSYMPAAWRADDYLNQQSDDDDDLASLRQHKLEFAKAPGAGVDAMARTETLDDYVVFDPLLEQAKGKFSRAAQKEKKKQTQWAGRAHG